MNKVFEPFDLLQPVLRYACVHACVTFGRAGRVTGELALTAAHRSWTPAFSCLNSHSLCTYTHTHVHSHLRLIDQIDLHMSDGANFSPFPPLVNLWPLIYTSLNLYTLIMLSCFLLLPFTHSFCCVQCSVLTHAPAVSAQVARRLYKNILKDSETI